MADLTKVNLDNLWSSTGNKVSPSNQKVDTGWVAGEIPPAEHQNWWQNRVDRILSYLYQKGIPEWSSAQEYIANKSVVIEGGKIWMCKSTHTNKRPSTDTARTYWREPAINLADIPNASSSVYGVVRVSNSLTNTSTTDALSAAQGKSLQDNKMNKSSNLSDITSVSTARNNLGLGTASTHNVTTSTTDTGSNRVLRFRDFGIGSALEFNDVEGNNHAGLFSVGSSYTSFGGVAFPEWTMYLNMARNSAGHGAMLAINRDSMWFARRNTDGTGNQSNPVHEVVHSGNIAQTTGNSTTVPMSQQAVSNLLSGAIGGLGTAASHDVTTSQKDSTKGRVLRVGDFGIGSGLEGNRLPSASGPDEMRNGFWRIDDSIFPTEIANGDGCMLVIGNATDVPNSNYGESHQVAFGGNDAHMRCSDSADSNGNPNWNEWRKIVTDKNISSILSSTNALQAAYPVGSIYMNAKSNTNPASLLGFGTWQQYAAGRVLLGRGSGGGGTYNTREAVGGSKDAIVVSHNHSASSSNYNLSHTHSISIGSTNLNHTHTGTTNANNRGHVHSGNTGNAGGHNHELTSWSDLSSGSSGVGARYTSIGHSSSKYILTTTSVGNHYHGFTTGGENQNHTHSFTTGGALGNHSHSVSLGSWGGNHNHSITVNSTGSSGTDANMMPYIVVSIWVRTA